MGGSLVTARVHSMPGKVIVSLCLGTTPGGRGGTGYPPGGSRYPPPPGGEGGSGYPLGGDPGGGVQVPPRWGGGGLMLK